MIIIGLGNPGRQYAHTRHNIGWLVLDRLLSELGGRWKKEGDCCATAVNGHWLVKPAGFMNRSGSVIKNFLRRHQLIDQVAQLVIVHDDLDLPRGAIRRQFNRGPAGHRGVESIIDAFGTKSFHRLRLGVGSNRIGRSALPAEEYVLRNMSKNELLELQPAINRAVTELRQELGATAADSENP